MRMPTLNLKMTEIKTNCIYNMDCVDGMSMIPDGTIDLIITDPPFAIQFGREKAFEQGRDKVGPGTGMRGKARLE